MERCGGPGRPVRPRQLKPTSSSSSSMGRVWTPGQWIKLGKLERGGRLESGSNEQRGSQCCWTLLHPPKFPGVLRMTAQLGPGWSWRAGRPCSSLDFLEGSLTGGMCVFCCPRKALLSNSQICAHPFSSTGRLTKAEKEGLNVKEKRNGQKRHWEWPQGLAGNKERGYMAEPANLVCGTLTNPSILVAASTYNVTAHHRQRHAAAMIPGSSGIQYNNVISGVE